MAIPKRSGEGNESYKIADKRDIERVHGARASKIRYIENRSASMVDVVQRGKDIEYYPSGQYTGPGGYLIRLVEGEYPHPAYLVRRDPRHYTIIYPNPQVRFDIIRPEGEGQWRNAETGHAVDFEIVGTIERWTESRIRLSRD